MRITFLFLSFIFTSSKLFSQTETSVFDSGKCFAQCGSPLIYELVKTKTLTQPAHEKVVEVPQSFLVSKDTIIFPTADSMLRHIPGRYDVTTENISLGNGKSKTVSRYIVIQKPDSVFEPREYKTKVITVNDFTDYPAKFKLDYPAVFTYTTSNKLTTPDGQTEQVEILCPEKATAAIIHELKKKLIAVGFDVNSNSPTLSSDEEAQLKKFQNENELPIGELNIPTLDFLGIEY